MLVQVPLSDEWAVSGALDCVRRRSFRKVPDQEVAPNLAKYSASTRLPHCPVTQSQAQLIASNQMRQ